MWTKDGAKLAKDFCLLEVGFTPFLVLFYLVFEFM
jgi:hypothetical protein